MNSFNIGEYWYAESSSSSIEVGVRPLKCIGKIMKLQIDRGNTRILLQNYEKDLHFLYFYWSNELMFQVTEDTTLENVRKRYPHEFI